MSVAQMLHRDHSVTLFEKNPQLGGLVRCEARKQGLYHLLGGHVFNTKTPAVAEWFWQFFERSLEFNHLTRNAKILLDESEVGYPLENHLYQLSPEIQRQILEDLLELNISKPKPYRNFKEALLGTFGKTLCLKYFFPYNTKIWRTDLESIPVGWLEGKLPMPKLNEILFSNINRIQESAMVHASFFYAKSGGSQFIIDRLASGLDAKLNCEVIGLRRADEGWSLNAARDTSYDAVVFCGDIRRLGEIYPEVSKLPAYDRLRRLRTRGISNVFCECDPTDTSWLYIPGIDYAANRIIYTGAFSSSNNTGDQMTCVVEFIHGEQEEVMRRDIGRLPGNLRPVAMNEVADAYVIQDETTREDVNSVRAWAQQRRLFLCGRFAEWEYYNMDKAIEAAMRCASAINFTE